MGRAPCCEKVGLRRGRWTAEEDEILTKYIQANGEGSWRSLPKNAGLLRCGKSCRLRWVNYLRNDLKRGNISSEEEKIIIKLHASLGNRWSLIVSQLPGRTDNEIKNYWHSHLSRKVDTLICRPANLDPALQATVVRAKLSAPYKKKGGSTSRCGGKDKTYHFSQKGAVGISPADDKPYTESLSKQTRAPNSPVEEEEQVTMQCPSPDGETVMSCESNNVVAASNEDNSGSINGGWMVCPKGGEVSHEILGPFEGIHEDMFSNINEIIDNGGLLMGGSANGSDSLIDFCNIAPTSPSNYIMPTTSCYPEAGHSNVSSSNISAASSGFDDIGSVSNWDWDSLGMGNHEAEGGRNGSEEMLSWLWESDDDMDQCEGRNMGSDMVRWLLS